MHIKGCPRIIQQDSNNICGFGPRAIINAPVDRRKFLMMARSIQEFLADHVYKLKTNWYMTLRGNIETYSMNPTDPGAYGSSVVTNKIQITAVAYYNNLISEFDSVDDPTMHDNFMFSYQIKCQVDPQLPKDEVFNSCILKTRSWVIEKGPGYITEVNDQPGVIGKFPIITRGMQPFIYESQCPTFYLGTKMRGHFTFQYLEGPNKGELFNCQIGEFVLRLPEGRELIVCPNEVKF